jgi:hypothetical protein
MWQNTSSSNPASPSTPQVPSVSSPTYRLKHQGRRVAQIVKLKPEFVEKYKECHSKVWPEVLKQIKECNVGNGDTSIPIPTGFIETPLSREKIDPTAPKHS